MKHRPASTLPRGHKLEHAIEKLLRGRTAIIIAHPLTLATAEDWHQFVACLTIGGVARQLAHNCELVSWDGTHLRLKLDPSCNQLRVTSTEERLKRAVEEVLGVAVRLHLEVERPQQETPAQLRVREAAERQQAVEATLMADPLVQAIQEQFGAQWVPGAASRVSRSGRSAATRGER